MPLILVRCGGFPRFAAAIESPVANAAMNGDRAAVQLLLQKKADVNAPQADGATALQWAAYRDDLQLADLLIAAGANPKIANREGATALQLASLRGSAPMIEKLLNAGAEVNERGANGENTADVRCSKWEPRGLVRAGVQFSIAHPETEALLKKLMEERGISAPPPTNASICITEVCKGSTQ